MHVPKNLFFFELQGPLPAAAPVHDFSSTDLGTRGRARMACTPSIVSYFKNFKKKQSIWNLTKTIIKIIKIYNIK